MVYECVSVFPYAQYKRDRVYPKTFGASLLLKDPERGIVFLGFHALNNDFALQGKTLCAP